MLTAATAGLCGNPTAFPAAARVLLAISATAPPARESEGSRFPLSILSASLACSGVEMKGGFSTSFEVVVGEGRQGRTRARVWDHRAGRRRRYAGQLGNEKHRQIAVLRNGRLR